MGALFVSVGEASDRAAERAARLAYCETQGQRMAQIPPDSEDSDQATGGEGRPLGRHEFVELLVRAAVTRYVITGEEPCRCSNPNPNPDANPNPRTQPQP